MPTVMPGARSGQRKRTTGSIFNVRLPGQEQSQGYGTWTLVFDDCNRATITYDIPSAELQGVIELTRATNDNVALCQALNRELHGYQ